jgi:hypothetical protein
MLFGGTTALYAAVPSGVAPRTETRRAVADRTRGKRSRIVDPPMVGRGCADSTPGPRAPSLATRDAAWSYFLPDAAGVCG